MSEQRKIEIALLILRVSIGSFMLVWASLKFYRPGWMVNVFRNTYGQEWATQDLSFLVGSLQMLLVIAFIIGFARTFSYALMTLMHATGVIGSIPSLINFTKFPNNLLWTSVVTLGALVALFILRNHDNLLSVSAWRKSHK